MIMTIKDRVNHDIKEAMRARDQKKLTALRLISAAVKQIEVDERIEVDEARMLVILDKLAKQRTESLTIFTAQGRGDLAEQEQFELDLIRNYLPTPLSENEISHLIDDAFAATGASKMSDMGKVMAILKSQLQGRADMNTVSGIIKARLS